MANQREVELVSGDVEPLVAAAAGLAGDGCWINLWPGVDADDVPPRTVLGNLVGARGPDVPLATWTPTELGIQHATGVRAAARLADAGVPVPLGWAVVQDHPKRGLVVRPPADADPAEALGWLRDATEHLCPLPITGPWRAVIRTR